MNKNVGKALSAFFFVLAVGLTVYIGYFLTT